MEEVASTDTPTFLLHLSESLDDEHIITKFQKIMKPVMEPVMEALNVANSQIAYLQEQLDKKDEVISAVQDRVTDLEVRLDDQEQHGRRGLTRVFGSVDAKVLSLCNNQLKVKSPLDLEDLEVVHRVGRPPKKDDVESAVATEAPASLPAPACPILVKFASRQRPGSSTTRIC